MSLAIKAEQLCKSYWIKVPQADGRSKPVEKLALRDVSFEVQEGEVLGIIGRNGSGKSTLLKILSRITVPTRGRATVYGSTAALLEVGTGMHPEMTGRENIYLNGALLGMNKSEISAKFDEIVEFAEVSEYSETPIKHYSSGMKLRLAFAVAAYLSADVIIVDEVLAVGDAAFQKKCLGVLRAGMRKGRTTLFVSHHLPSVEGLCDRVMSLSDGQIKQIGQPSEVIREYLCSMNSNSVEAPNRIDLLLAPRGWTSEGGRIQEVCFHRLIPHGLSAPWVVAFGEPWSMSFSFRLNRGVVDVIAGIGVRSDTGQEVFTLHSCDIGLRFNGDEEETCSVSVDVGSANLLPGRYSIELALISGGILIDHLPDCTWILVEEQTWDGSPNLALKKGLTAPVFSWKVIPTRLEVGSLV